MVVKSAHATTTRTKCFWLVLLVLTSAGCGRYGIPLPPEALAPKAIEELTVTPDDSGVAFSWRGSDEDRRGKELKFVEGYRIQRKEIQHRGDETDPDILFDDVGFVEDKHVEKRDDARKKARAEGLVGRRVESPEEFMQFTFADTTVKKDSTYLYQIIPENQGGTEGVVKQIIKVTYKGAESDVTMLNSNELDEGDVATAKTSKQK